MWCASGGPQLLALIASFLQIFIWFTATSNQVWWDCGDIYGNILNRSQFCNSTGEFSIFHLSFQSSLPGRLRWNFNMFLAGKEATLRIKSELEMIDEWVRSQSVINVLTVGTVPGPMKNTQELHLLLWGGPGDLFDDLDFYLISLKKEEEEFLFVKVQQVH